MTSFMKYPHTHTLSRSMLGDRQKDGSHAAYSQLTHMPCHFSVTESRVSRDLVHVVLLTAPVPDPGAHVKPFFVGV